MTHWSDRALQLIEAGEPAVLVTICATMGSAPREAGTKMLVWADRQHGTIGGGNLEFMTCDQARKMLVRRDCAYRIQDYPLGPLVAQCCGGHVRLLLERVDASSKPWLESVRAAFTTGHALRLVSRGRRGSLTKSVEGASFLWSAGILPALTVTDEEKNGRDARAPWGVMIFDARGRRLMGTKPIHNEEITIVETVRPEQHDLVMFGAGHVGQAVARIVATLPFRVNWMDARTELAELGPSEMVRVQHVTDPVASVGNMPTGAFYLVFSHSHDLDYRLVRAILERGDFRYCGLIGSATKRARFESRLARDGISALDIARLTCPVGAIGLSGKAPEILAVGVAAELLLAIEAETERPVRHKHSARTTHDQ